MLNRDDSLAAADRLSLLGVHELDGDLPILTFCRRKGKGVSPSTYWLSISRLCSRPTL